MENNINNQEVTDVFKEAFDNFSKTASIQQEQVETDQNAQEDSVVETVQEDNAQELEKTNEDPSNKAFAKMRTENASMSRKINDVEQAIKTLGYSSIQDFLDKQKEADVKNTAQQQGIPVEVEKRLRALEQERARYQENERTSAMRQEVNDLVREYNISKDEWSNFIQQLQDDNINPLASNIPLKTLYIQYNMDSIFNARLAKEKAAWTAEVQRVQQSVPITVPAGAPQPSSDQKKNIDFRSLGKNFKK